MNDHAISGDELLISIDPRPPIHLKPVLLVENYTVGRTERCDRCSETLRGEDAAHFGEL